MRSIFMAAKILALQQVFGCTVYFSWKGSMVAMPKNLWFRVCFTNSYTQLFLMIFFFSAQTRWCTAASEAEGEGVWRNYGSLASWHWLSRNRERRIKGEAKELLKESSDRGHIKSSRSVDSVLYDIDNCNHTYICSLLACFLGAFWSILNIFIQFVFNKTEGHNFFMQNSTESFGKHLYLLEYPCLLLENSSEFQSLKVHCVTSILLPA